jgi:hypothetical protein
MEITPAGLSCVQINESQKGLSVGKSPVFENHIQSIVRFGIIVSKFKQDEMNQMGYYIYSVNKRTSYFVRQPYERNPYLCIFEYPIAI